jgi:hypothetical protein
MAVLDRAGEGVQRGRTCHGGSRIMVSRNPLEWVDGRAGEDVPYQRYCCHALIVIIVRRAAAARELTVGVNAKYRAFVWSFGFKTVQNHDFL